MSNWQSIYEEKVIDCTEAVQMVNSSQNLFLSAYVNEPQSLVDELIDQRERLKGLTMFVNVVGSQAKYASEKVSEYFNIKTFLSNISLNEAFKRGNCDYIPINVSQIPRFIHEQQTDVAFIQLTPPNAEGYCSLGTSVDVNHHLIKNASLVIAEVNEGMPFTHGDSLVNVRNVDYFVLSDKKVNYIEFKEPDDIALKIGRLAADLIPDGATIQWGIGNVPNSVVSQLTNKSNIKVHSGSISDSIIEMIQEGNVVEPIIATSIIGTNRLYEFAHNNEAIHLLPVDETHNVHVLGSKDQFFSINSAVEVDISGQVNAEKLNGQTIAGVGGQMDFIVGSNLSSGGRSMIVLPSSTKNEKHSKIVHRIQEVTSLKSHVDYVVTEYGIAKLFGKTLAERMKNDKNCTSKVQG